MAVYEVLGKRRLFVTAPSPEEAVRKFLRAPDVPDDSPEILSVDGLPPKGDGYEVAATEVPDGKPKADAYEKAVAAVATAAAAESRLPCWRIKLRGNSTKIWRHARSVCEARMSVERDYPKNTIEWIRPASDGAASIFVENGDWERLRLYSRGGNLGKALSFLKIEDHDSVLSFRLSERPGKEYTFSLDVGRQFPAAVRRIGDRDEYDALLGPEYRPTRALKVLWEIDARKG